MNLGVSPYRSIQAQPSKTFRFSAHKDDSFRPFSLSDFNDPAQTSENQRRFISRWIVHNGLTNTNRFMSNDSLKNTKLSEAEWSCLNQLLDHLEKAPSSSLKQPRYQTLLNMAVMMDLPSKRRHDMLQEATQSRLTVEDRFAFLESRIREWVALTMTPYENGRTTLKDETAINDLPRQWQQYLLAFSPLPALPPLAETPPKVATVLERLHHLQAFYQNQCPPRQLISPKFLTMPISQEEWRNTLTEIYHSPSREKATQTWIHQRLWAESLKTQPDEALVKWDEYYDGPTILAHKNTQQLSANPQHTLWHALALKGGPTGVKAFNKLLPLVQTTYKTPSTLKNYFRNWLRGGEHSNGNEPLDTYIIEHGTPKEQQQAWQRASTSTLLNILNGTDLTKQQTALFRLLPTLLFDHSPHLTPVEYHLKVIEDREYKAAPKTPTKWHHPSEAEMLLLLRHPKDPLRLKSRPVVLALTSVYDHLKNNVRELSDAIIKLWSDIGFYSHGFLFWKYDARGGKNSLLAQFGAAPLKDPYTQQWGKGFVAARYTNPLLPLSPQTTIVMYQPFLTVTHPNFGTLLIRNSSDAPNAGRTKLRHAAYYSPQALSVADLARVHPDQDPRFKSVLDHRLYDPSPETDDASPLAETRNPDSPMAMEHVLSFLLGQLDRFKAEYQRWKFDVTGANGKPGKKMKSDGFVPVLKAVLGADNPDTPLQEILQNPPETAEKRALAFVNPYYPPWATLPFTGRKGQMFRYSLTGAHLEELKALFDNRWPKTREKLQKIDFYNFLQAGIQAGGELMILSDTPTQGE